jgi:phospholipase C
MRARRARRFGVAAAAISFGVAAVGVGACATPAAPRPSTATPIQHLVVIYQENVSFDHYFGTYPTAANTGGPRFTPAPGTPTVNGLSGALLSANPNGTNPRRYDPSATADVLMR